MYRPDRLDGFIGQEQVKKQVQMVLAAAKKKGTPLPHVLLSGPSGTGKTTLAKILAAEMEDRLVITTPNAVKRNEDLFQVFVKGMAKRLPGRMVLFLDEAHRLSAQVQEDLYLPMEDRILIKKGQVPTRHGMEPWTLVAATTAPGDLEEPFLNRFGLHLHMESYTHEETAEILRQSADKNQIFIEDEALNRIAERSRFNPRIANHLLDRCHDYALVEGDGTITEGLSEEAFEVIDIDAVGFTELDRQYLTTLYNAERPLGLQSLVPILHVDKETIARAIEPFMVESGFVILTARGRQIAQKGVEYMEELYGGGDRLIEEWAGGG